MSRPHDHGAIMAQLPSTNPEGRPFFFWPEISRGSRRSAATGAEPPRPSPLAFGEVFLGIERGHASHPRTRHRLAIDVIGQVPGGKEPRDRAARAARLDMHVIAVMHLDLALDELGGRG